MNLQVLLRPLVVSLAVVLSAQAADAPKSVLTWPDGARYEGEVRDGKRHGKGRFAWPGGQNWYEGDYVEGHRHGKGTQLYNGHRYEGDFVAGKFHGKGVLLLADGIRYEGDFADNARHGHGVMTWPSGHRYEGEFREGRRTGQGVMAYPNGDRYEGGFLDDKRAGLGVTKFANGNRYEGGYLDDKFSGKGVYTWPNGTRYEGDFANNNFHGQGVKTWPDGDFNAGQWVNDQPQQKTQSARGGSSVNSGQVIAGVIGLGVIGSAQGLSGAERARVAAGFLGDVATDGKGKGIQGALTDARNARIQPAEIQAVIARQQQAGQQRATQPAPASAPRPQVAAAAPVPAAPAPDFDALLRAAPKTEKYTFTCGPYTGPEMLPADVPGSCMAEQKRHMQIQCFPGWLFDESYGALRRCAAERSTGKFKVEHQQRLDAFREMLRRDMPRCAPDGCSGREHLGIL